MTKGERLKHRRDMLGLTQVEVADALGVSKQLYYKYENDVITNIPSNRIEELARILNVSPEYIMGWDENKERIAKESVDAAEISLALHDDPALVQALKVYLKLPPDKKRHVIDSIHLLGKT
ncbi:MAG: helix-turn-helix transcriptional regulator [Lachnospiraceae bacterium]|nr:helix-turn-helix transcriptional regulator [Lachnospiraceae bacterium]